MSRGGYPYKQPAHPRIMQPFPMGVFPLPRHFQQRTQFSQGGAVTSR